MSGQKTTKKTAKKTTTKKKVTKKKIAAAKLEFVDPGNKPTIRAGSRGLYVIDAQERLRGSGVYVQVDGFYGTLTSEAVREFQMSHLGSKGEPLAVDGVVGRETWWALYNSTAAHQKTGLGSVVQDTPQNPDGLSDLRLAFVDALWEAYALDIREIPDGSNWGGHVTKILENAGGPRPWCAHAISWIWKRAFGSYPNGRDHGHVLTFWREAITKGQSHEVKDGYQPKPGDLGVMLYKRNGRLTGSGHIFAVVANDGAAMNTIEGNSGNRLKVGWRSRKQSTLVGFINLFGDSDVPATLGTVKKAEALASDFKSTR